MCFFNSFAALQRNESLTRREGNRGSSPYIRLERGTDPFSVVVTTTSILRSDTTKDEKDEGGELRKKDIYKKLVELLYTIVSLQA